VLLKKELGVFENSYYEATVTRPASRPALARRLHADVCVVGGGYAGVSAALELAERGFDVVLLEAQRIGWGASGRNGGQAIVGYGSDGEAAIERQFPREDAQRAWDVSVEGMRLLKQRIARYGIACEWQPGYLSLTTKPRKSRDLRRWMDHVESVYDYPQEWVEGAAIRQWVDSARFHAAVHDAGSGHLHPLKYCLGLGAAAAAAGVRIFENSPVLLLERGRKPVVKTAQGECACDFVVLAGNVYLAEYGDDVAPEVSSRIMPVGTYMIATEPMEPARARALMPRRCAASDTNFILDYFRVSADDRLLFGGGDSYTGTTQPGGPHPRQHAGRVPAAGRPGGQPRLGRVRRHHDEQVAPLRPPGQQHLLCAGLLRPWRGAGRHGGPAGGRGHRGTGGPLRPHVTAEAPAFPGGFIDAHARLGAGHVVLPPAGRLLALLRLGYHTGLHGGPTTVPPRGHDDGITSTMGYEHA
jgi:gamma-glutamylputrescine oxidase